MSGIFVQGLGAVSPAGWGMAPLLQAVETGQPLAALPATAPSGIADSPRRSVPAPDPRPPFIAHPRLRRASAISHFAMGAAVEALGGWPLQTPPEGRLGIILGTHTGSIRYSERFFAEVRQDPATASPMLFPETVFNAPASHVAACLGGEPRTYTLVGDQTVFLQALALGAGWLCTEQVDHCLVIGAEESHWPVSVAAGAFARGLVLSEGAGALLLARQPPTASTVQLTLTGITDAHSHAGQRTRHPAVQRMRNELSEAGAARLLVDGRCGVRRIDDPEECAWLGWPADRLSPKVLLGEGLSAGSAWQCVVACRRLLTAGSGEALVSVPGFNGAAMGARFGLD
jgi:3-oxoacyl-(acyl-carrier-protein) synthase